ncbi:MAG: BtpA/SgcQ family protein [Bdellovibrionales bacterium]|jgi:uncharacterized protein|nr:BtpA/SgcQ family protein [Bdellovibrionales bacterium]MBT3524967.1 BtpA/SgcQ family protein [Bdellovibrionales bacterium]MBT7670351.1 BtpA/SgcQ family protein [Bdellovibrionales bacterium]MBT7766677.1 BtpA/SgcQ family protein [Bdellovibrionales bacterium]
MFSEIFKVKKPIIGMIHVRALPGTPKFAGEINPIIDQAIQEALAYKKAGIDSIAIENMHDTPYLKGEVGPEITAMMSIVGCEVKRASNLPCGIQILAGANIEAMAVAQASQLDFIRAEGFAFAHVADEGLIESSAGRLLRYRKQMGADNIAVFSDIKKKHSSHAITSDIDIAETAKAVEFFGGDGVIITGMATGTTADIDELTVVKQHSKIPVLVGSGVTIDNVELYLKHADGLIVGSYFKKDGYWENKLDYDKISQFMTKVGHLRT